MLRLSFLAVLTFLASFTSALSQSVPTPIPNARTAFGPYIAVMNGIVFAAWRGPGSPKSAEDDQQLYLAMYRSGKWENPVQIPGKSMFSPALAVDGETLFVAWHDPGNLFTGTGEGKMYFGSYRKESGFASLGAIPQAASAGPPSLAIYRGLVYAAWRGLGNITLGYGVPGNEHWVLYATYDPREKQWSSEHSVLRAIVHANSATGPCLATVNDKLYAIWRGTGSLTFHGASSNPGDPLISYASFDGTTWSAQNLPLPTIPGARAAWGASATEWNGKLCVGWRGDQPWDGAKGDQTFYFAILNENQQWRRIDLFKDLKLRGAFGPSLASDRASGTLWAGWRGAFDSSQGLDDQSLYVTSFGAAILQPEPSK